MDDAAHAVRLGPATPSDFQSRRARLIEAGGRLRALASGVGGSGPAAGFAVAERRLIDAIFKLLVIGEYKRGKSTLINALLGKPLLPAGALPLTSVATEIAHGEVPEARIELASGASLRVEPDRLAEFVTEPGNPGNARGVRRVLVLDRDPWLAAGVRIVDTPGVGSIHGLSTVTTYDYLGEADAVVLVLAADQPLGAEERALLEALRPHTDRVLVVLNRVDLVSATDLESVIEFTRHQLARACGLHDAPIFPLSARQALDARMLGGADPAPFARFGSRLRRLLVEERGEILIERARGLIARSADLIRIALEAERQAACANVADLERAIARFAAGAGQVRASDDEARAVFRHGVTRLKNHGLRELEERTAARVRAAVWPRVLAGLEDDRRDAFPSTVRDLSMRIGEWVATELREHDVESAALMTAHFTTLVDTYEARVGELIGQIADLARRQVGVAGRSLQATAPLGERVSFYFRTWDGATGALPRSAWMVLRLPSPWVIGFARAWLGEIMDRRIRQNLSAIRHDWSLRLDDAVRALEASSAQQLDSTIHWLTEALARGLEIRRESQVERAAEEERIACALNELARVQDLLRGAAPGRNP